MSNPVIFFDKNCPLQGKDKNVLNRYQERRTRTFALIVVELLKAEGQAKDVRISLHWKPRGNGFARRKSVVAGRVEVTGIGKVLGEGVGAGSNGQTKIAREHYFAKAGWKPNRSG